ncbi:MAG: hypothetical protein AAB336_11025 [Acidobacteriota bacterium]
MNLFEDLVTDLQKEHLLDDGVNEHHVFIDSWALPNPQKIETSSNSIFKEVSIYYGNSSVKIPNFKEVLPNKSSMNQTQFVASNDLIPAPPANHDSVLLLSPLPPKKLQKVQIKTKKKGRFCKTCLIAVPYYRFNCRFCGERVAGGFYYYSIILLSILTLLTLFFAIIVNKTYK